MTLYTRGFSRFVTSTTAPVATGWSNSCRVGSRPRRDRAFFQAHEIVRPFLHHLPPQRQMLGVVVGGFDRIPFYMRELPLDCFGVPTLFVQQRRRDAAEAMCRHLIVRVTEPAERGVERVIAHRPAP